MYQRDYILRMIEKIGVLLNGILGRIKKGDFQEASESIDNAYQDILKEDAAFFNNIPLANLTDNLIGEHNYTNGHLEILSELFYAQAELSYAQGIRNESLQYFQKSLKLLEFVSEESKLFSLDKQSRISSIKKRISDLSS
jgi:adenylate kinase family enzyme